MIRRAFDTDKLAFTELLGVPYAIRGVARRRPSDCVPGIYKILFYTEKKAHRNL